MFPFSTNGSVLGGLKSGGLRVLLALSLGWSVSPVLGVTISSTALNFTLCSGTLPVKTVTASWTKGVNITSGKTETLTVSAPATLEVSFTGTSWSQTASTSWYVSSGGATTFSKTIYIRPAPTTTTATSGTVSFVSAQGADVTKSFSISEGFSILSTVSQSRCGSGTLTLEATSNGGTLTWYDALTGGNAVGTGGLFTTPSLTQSTTYYVAAVSTACTNPTRIPVIANVVAQPALTLQTTTVSRCGSGTVRLKASTSPGFNVYWKQGSGASVTQFDAASSVYLPVVNTHTDFSAVAGNAQPGCESAPQTVSVTVSQRAEWSGTGSFTDSTLWSCGSAPGSGTTTIFASGTCQISEDVELPAGNRWRIRPGAGVSVDPGIALSVSGNLVNHGTLHLNADVTGYAQLHVAAGGTYADSSTGTVTSERYMDETGWTGLASPFSVPLSQWGSVGAAGQANLYHWNAATSAWIPNTSGTALAVPGRGYNGYIGSGGLAASGSTLALTGTPIATATPVLDYHDGTGSAVAFYNEGTNPAARKGWNLIGNPFLSNLDFTTLLPSSNGVNTGFYVWRNTLNGGSYRAHGPLATGAAQYSVIEPMQAVWVQANTAQPSLGSNWTPQSKGTRMRRTFNKGAGVDRIVVQLNALTHPTRSDDLVLGMVSGSSDGFEPDWDARELAHTGDFPNLYTITPDGDALTHKSIPYHAQATQCKTVALGVSTPLPHVPYRIGLDPAWTTSGYTVFLHDRWLRNLHPLHQSDYIFLGADSLQNRFTLILGTASSGSPTSALGMENGILFPGATPTPQAWIQNGTLHIQGLPEGPHTLEMFDLLGRRLLQSPVLIGSEDSSAQIPLSLHPTEAPSTRVLRWEGGVVRVAW